MSLSGPAGETAHFLSDDSEAEEPGARPGHAEGAGDEEDEEPASGVSVTRAQLTVAILCYINLLNYMDRFTIAVFVCSYMILAPCFGYLGDRYNRKWIMSVGIAFWSLVTLASSYTPPHHFWALLLTRGLVGVGEASYSTIAPTIIADLYVKEKRTVMLALFYFAIPVTPGLGLLAVLLLLFVVREPKRGAVEARPEHHLHRTSWATDMKALSRK
ncbi:hypothetical protein CRUP_017878 [Coryphaenoides rupestris]|nr:hypothetical protein CRUP_017878 [Coryphaenoides rupestris]